MIHEIEVWMRRLRRRLSRSEWLIRLLGLSRSEGTASKPGVVLIQIDGLSRPQMEKAMDRGRLPFLRKLMKRHRYQLHSVYSGVPSTTPAVTAELLYGKKAAVPSFDFLDRETRRVFRMFDPSAAKEIQKRLETQGQPLLAGGSAYAGIYTAGADESHFCAASLGLSDFFRAKRPFALLAVFLFNFYSLVRTLTLLIFEFFLAFVDCAKGLFAGRDLWKEIKFIPSRVGVSILMRELSVIGTKVDVARGLPVVFLNLLGYDEQSHRRGPSSEFAHWSLKGIDDAVARIWKAARQSTRRDYDVWIFSDHGGEDTLSYTRENGRTVQEALAEVFEQTCEVLPVGMERGVQSTRSGAYLRSLDRSDVENSNAPEKPVVTAMGPIGHVYLPDPVSVGDRDRLAQAMIDRAKIPMVLAADESGRARVWTKDGRFTLPRDASSILAEDHPFKEAAARDLAALCHHPNAGDFIIAGWRRTGRPYTFPTENGAHGGPGPRENHAFALVPGDVTLPPSEEGVIRMKSLRQTALHHLGRNTIQFVSTPAQSVTSNTLRVMTYNIHSCIGLDGKLSPERIGRVIARYHPDIVALQEVDVGRARTGRVDQAEAIARFLNMEYYFHPAMRVAGELYGDCILSRLPVRLIKADLLPSMPSSTGLEPRGALWVSLDCAGTRVHLLNTHLGLKGREKLHQIYALLGRQWLGAISPDEPVIFCGDLNAIPRSPVWRQCRERFRDVQLDGRSSMPQATWFGYYPMVRIDHIFVSAPIEVGRVEVPNDYLALLASDHRPLLAELHLRR